MVFITISPFYIEEMKLANVEGYKVKLYQNLEQQTEKQKTNRKTFITARTKRCYCIIN